MAAPLSGGRAEPTSDGGVGRLFLETAAFHLSEDYLRRVRACVERLGGERLWWRPNDASNSVGHLLLHLAGNLRQWVVSGVGGAPDTRVRHEEFDRNATATGEELMGRLEDVVTEAADTLRGLDPSLLTEVRTIQGRETTVLQAIVHAVEHFSMHTGQIIYVAKLLTDEEPHFYAVEDGVATPSWDAWGEVEGG